MIEELEAEFRSLLDQADNLFTNNFAEKRAVEVQELVNRYPQLIEGEFQYLLTSGYAVSLLTGHRRIHSDVDIVRFKMFFPRWIMERDTWAPFDLDMSRPDTMHGDLNLDPNFLRQTAAEVNLTSGFKIYTVNPTVILAAKMADDTTLERSRGRAVSPRSRDIFDSVAILTSRYRRNPQWEKNLEEALAGLQKENRTVSRRRIQLLDDIALGVRFDEALITAAKVWTEPLPE